MINTSVFLQRSPGKPHFLFMISHHTYPAGFTLWPGGTYGLPKALSGCPSSQTFRWQTGWRFQDSEGVFSDNAKSAEFHLDGWVGFTGVNRSFCIKPGGDVNTTGWQKGERIYLSIYPFIYPFICLTNPPANTDDLLIYLPLQSLNC